MIFKTHVLFCLLFISTTLNSIVVLCKTSPSESESSYILTCGDSSPGTDSDGRKWEPDSKYINPSGNSLTAAAKNQDPSLPSTTPYMTARVFTSQSSYKFSVPANSRLWIRLHFYPSTYSSLNPNHSYFSVSANTFTLLKNFSASITALGLTTGLYHQAIFSDATRTATLVGFTSQSIDVAGSALRTMYRLKVDSNFTYVVRFHFCEYQERKVNLRVFDIFVNNQTAQEGADVIGWSGAQGVPVYKDYAIRVNDKSGGGDQELWIALHPTVSTKPEYYDAILNGMEIFKLRRKSTVSGKASASSQLSSLPQGLCRHFSLIETKQATKNFSESQVIGVGGFGKVFRGVIDQGTEVAIKRSNPSSQQGVNEFVTEIEMLSKLRHKHLVSLIGFCEEDGEMALVYDYMANGTLREHLHKGNENPALTWKQRLEICIGAARGLHYLHTGARHTIIHRDVKTTNILLDSKWVAKVSDFGLSKTGPLLDQTHVSTVVKGSFGYLDPEYYRRQQLTEKSDVYSFGVVLFEVSCARPALDPCLPKEQVSLAEWAVHCLKEGLLEDTIDPHLKGQIDTQSFYKFVDTAEKCLADNGLSRPSMGDVLWNLEYALQLQEKSAKVDLIAEESKIVDMPVTGEESREIEEVVDQNNNAKFSHEPVHPAVVRVKPH
ncbi:hypothetical protein Tsubulata_023818 [Turnera subulata]|uniref:Protein kinase domain-containing protein n=1 Tax=Turnera subulata TaxID=218843 RepID=A0A9Q0FYN1_9ROSI|nr:hypothetical protein Tsubulata_023818 [Turnera subulata]